jgi:uncharacterized protein YecE (DUF72 family)
VTLYVGTSGWAYPEWKPGFYPQDLPRTRFLEHYSQTLSACEINATFYRLQSDRTFGRWIAATPESFRFAAKAHRRLTHSKSIAPDAEQRGFLDTFLSSLSVIGPRLGPVLFQLPPYRHRDDEALSALVSALPAGTPFAFEFRHESWSAPAIPGLVARFGGTLCLAETKGEVPGSLPDGPIAYVRLRFDRYSDDGREGWRELLLTEAKERDVFAFTKHEGLRPEDTYGGVGLARWLAQA